MELEPDSIKALYMPDFIFNVVEEFIERSGLLQVTRYPDIAQAEDGIEAYYVAPKGN